MAPETAPARTAAVAALAEQVSGTLRLATALAGNGRRIDLAGLDEMVGRLCAQALDLPPGEGALIKPRLAALGRELDALQRSLAPD